MKSGIPERQTFRGYPPSWKDPVIAELWRFGIEIVDYEIDIEDYRKYLSGTGYEKEFPRDKPISIHGNALQHYLAAKLLRLNKSDVCLDISNINSPDNIYRKLYEAETFRLDARDIVGSDGDRAARVSTELAFADGFATKIALCASFELFEGDSDMEFIREAARVLRPGGALCILPLYLTDIYSTITDSAITASADLKFEEDAMICCVEGHGTCFARMYDAEHLARRLRDNSYGLTMKVINITNAREVDESCRLEFAALFEKALSPPEATTVPRSMTAKSSMKGILINHNTSLFAELALRSLFAMNKDIDDLKIVIADNNSEDRMSGLIEFAKGKNIEVFQTPWTPKTRMNTHGEILTRFVLSNPEPDYFLFLDSDIMFCEEGTIASMLSELSADGKAWAAAADATRDCRNEVSWEFLRGARFFDVRLFFSDSSIESLDKCMLFESRVFNADRCHPFCVLIKNSEIFRKVVKETGISYAFMPEAGGGKVWETLGLVTAVMKTHGLHYLRSEKKVLHFFGTTYAGPDWVEKSIQQATTFLEKFRTGERSVDDRCHTTDKE